MEKGTVNLFFDKIKNAPENVKATFFFGIATFTISGVNYGTTPIFTRLLSTSEYGIISIYNSWLSIVQVVMSLTLIYPGVLNVGLYEYKDNRWKYLSTMLGVITVTSVLTMTGYFCFQNYINQLIGIPVSLIILMLITSFLRPAINLWTAKQRYEYKYKTTLFVTVGTAIGSQIISILAVLLAKKQQGWNLAVIKLWSAGTITIFVAILIYIYILKKGTQFYNKALWKETCLITIPLIPHYLSHVVLSGVDKIMIGNMISNEKAGIYALAAVLSSIGILFWRALLTTFSPFVNTKLGEKKFKEIGDAVKILWYFTGSICVIGALLSPEIIILFGTKDYLEGINVVPPVIVSVFTYAMYDVFAAVSFFHKKSLAIMFASIIAALSNIIMNYYGILRFGYIAAGYTTLIAHIILILMHYINVVRIEKEVIYNGKIVLFSLIAVMTACFSCNWLYESVPSIRYLLTLVILTILWTKRNVLFSTLANMKV